MYVLFRTFDGNFYFARHFTLLLRQCLLCVRLFLLLHPIHETRLEFDDFTHHNVRENAAIFSPALAVRRYNLLIGLRP